MDRDRGQLLLVAGLGLALAFVVLALVLNAVVFTENLATRNHGETDDVVGYERAVEAGVGGLLVQTNTYDDADHASLRSALEAGVGTWDANASLLTASSGTITAASVQSVENGTRIVQADERNFSDASGAGDWTPVADVEETRRFEMVVTPNGSDPLTVNVSDGATEWRVEIVDAGSDTVVEVKNETSPITSETVASDTVAVDVTEGTVNGTRVPGWTFAENVSTGYDVQIENGGDADGKYGFVVYDASVNGDNYANRSSGSPTAVPALYSANVTVHVQDARVTYETNVTVAPEESPAAPPWASPTE
jgi:hypothetical protein